LTHVWEPVTQCRTWVLANDHVPPRLGRVCGYVALCLSQERVSIHNDGRWRGRRRCRRSTGNPQHSETGDEQQHRPDFHDVASPRLATHAPSTNDVGLSRVWNHVMPLPRSNATRFATEMESIVAAGGAVAPPQTEAPVGPVVALLRKKTYVSGAPKVRP
jgi:hypothetical protein